MVILFDFDGTIADSLTVYLAFYNQYLTKRGQETISKESFRSLGVLTLAKRHHIPKWQLFWMVLIGRQYAARHIHEVHPFPDIREQLEKLSKKHTLGIVTSNSKRNVVSFLQKNNMTPYFSFVESKISYFGKAQKLSQVIKKYNIKIEECVYVGDETRDMVAAKKVGIGAICVLWGFENDELLFKCQPDITITKVTYLSQKLSGFFLKN